MPKTLQLTRSDLAPNHRDKPAEELKLTHFCAKYHLFGSCEEISFVEKGKITILKTPK
jgi:hypothetical protein